MPGIGRKYCPTSPNKSTVIKLCSAGTLHSPTDTQNFRAAPRSICSIKAQALTSWANHHTAVSAYRARDTESVEFTLHPWRRRDTLHVLAWLLHLISVYVANYDCQWLTFQKLRTEIGLLKKILRFSLCVYTLGSGVPNCKVLLSEVCS